MHIVLLGDSIFDNGPYVDAGHSVSELLAANLKDAEISLLAVDGDVTTDVNQQLNAMPCAATHVFVSCGGNDALRSIPKINRSANTVGGALHILREVTEDFRLNYKAMLSSILSKHSSPIACTIYNRVPGLSDIAKTALSIFNEIILEEAFALDVPIIDLRIIFNNEEDFSPVSPIEPSVHGGRKIVKRISDIVTGDHSSLGVYT